jgi:hypothetical protein
MLHLQGLPRLGRRDQHPLPLPTASSTLQLQSRHRWPDQHPWSYREYLGLVDGRMARRPLLGPVQQTAPRSLPAGIETASALYSCDHCTRWVLGFRIWRRGRFALDFTVSRILPIHQLLGDRIANLNTDSPTQILRLRHGRRGPDFRPSRNDDLCQRLLFACQCRRAIARQRAQGMLLLQHLLSGRNINTSPPCRTSWRSDSYTVSMGGWKQATSMHSALKPECMSQYWLWPFPWLCTVRGLGTRLRSGG